MTDFVPEFFPVEADYQAFVEDASTDSDYDMEAVPVSGNVLFTPEIKAGDVVAATSASPRPIGFVPATISAVIHEGRLKLRSADDSGASGGPGFVPVKLLCDSPGLGLSAPLQYKVTFSNITFASGRRGSITGFNFVAPSSGDVTINLISVGRVPSQSGVGIVRLAPTGVRVDGEDIVFTAGGVDIDDPIPASIFVGASGASGASGGTGGPGATGSTGPVGATGPTGSTGASGVPGGVTSLNGSTGAITGVMTVTGAQTPQNKTFTDPSNTWPAFIKRSIDTVTAPRVLGASGAVDCVTLVDMRGDIAVLRLDGASGSTTITDSSPVASNWTAVGNTQISTAQSKWGGSSIYFDGTGDYIAPSANHNQFSFGTGDFTIEFWARPTGALNVARGWVSWHAEGVNAPQYLSIESKADGNIAVYTNNYKITGTVPLTTNTWYHIALCRSGGNTRLFVDGVQAGSTLTADTQSYVCPGAGRPRFGASGYYENAAGNNFIGFMDDIRITKGYGRYAANFTPPTGPVGDEITEPAATAVGTVALLHGNGASGSVVMTDSGCLLSNWAVTGDTKISTAQSKYGGSSIYLDGVGDRLTATADASHFGWGAGDFTIELWARLSSVTGAIVLFDGRPASTNGAYSTIHHDGCLQYMVSSTNRIVGPTLSVDTWYHIAVCRSGTSTKLFVDGTQVGSTWTDTTTYVASQPRVGASSYGGGAVTGHLQDIRLSRIARYTSGFTPPAALLPDVPVLRLPGASGHTIQHTIKTVGLLTSLLAPPTGQVIDGASGPVSIAADVTKKYIPDPAGTGWRSI